MKIICKYKTYLKKKNLLKYLDTEIFHNFKFHDIFKL